MWIASPLVPKLCLGTGLPKLRFLLRDVIGDCDPD